MTYPVAGEEYFPVIDVTSTAAIAMLEGFLRSGVGVGRVIGWHGRGRGKRRRDTIFIRGQR
jgi:hypothetical protein